MKSTKNTKSTAARAKSPKQNADKEKLQKTSRSRHSATAGMEDYSRRDELIAKSAKLFREKGYEKTTVRDIAAAVGMQAGSWFYHFKTKHDILVAVMEQGMTQSLQEIESIVAQSLPPRETFQQLVLAHLKTLFDPHNDFIPVLLYEARSLDKAARAKVAALTDRYQAIWDKVIDALHRSGEWSMPTKLDRLLLFGALNWTAQWFKPGADVSIEELADQAVLFILRSVPKKKRNK